MSWCLVGAAGFCLVLAIVIGLVHPTHVDVRQLRPLAFLRGCIVIVFLSSAIVLVSLALGLFLYQVHP